MSTFPKAHFSFKRIRSMSSLGVLPIPVVQDNTMTPDNTHPEGRTNPNVFRKLNFDSHGGSSKKIVTVSNPDPRDELISQLQRELAEMRKERRQSEDKESSRTRNTPHTTDGEKSTTLQYSNIPTFEGREQTHDSEDEASRRKRESTTAPPVAYKLKVPFSRRLMSIHIPKHLQTTQPLSIGKYNGETDPTKHLDAYVFEAMYLGANEDVMCRMFPQTLSEEALGWFKGLPSGSIDSWAEMAATFETHFVISRDVPRTSHTLAQIKQGENEGLKDFLKRFYKEAALVPNLTESIKLHIVIEALQPGSAFALSLAKSPPVTFEEFRKKASKYVSIEMHLEAIAAKKKPSTPPSQTQKGKEKTRSERMERPFTNPKILREVGWPAFSIYGIRRPAPMKRPGNPRKYYDFHEQNGHSTDECQALKNTVETLIREGKLKQYLFKEKSFDRVERNEKRERDPDDGDDNNRNPVRKFSASEKQKGVMTDEIAHKDSMPQQQSQGRREVIDMITGGFAGGGALITARKNHHRMILSVQGKVKENRPYRGGVEAPIISFSDEDFGPTVPGGDDAVVITAVIANKDVRRILVDQGSSCDVIFYNCFERMGFKDSDLQPYTQELTAFNGAKQSTKGYLDTLISFEGEPGARTVKSRVLVIDVKSPFNGIIGRPTLNAMEAVVSTPHLLIKFIDKDNTVSSIRGDQEMARYCYNLSLNMTKLEASNKKRKLNDSGAAAGSVSLVDLDPRADLNIDPSNPLKPTPDRSSRDIVLGDSPEKITHINDKLDTEMEQRLLMLLQEFKDLFAWTAADMPGIDPAFCYHKLSVYPETRPVAQKKRRLGPEKQKAVCQQTEELLKAEFIKEIRYSSWLSNVVMVRKSNGKWRICIDYVDLNHCCPKDPYPLPNIDRMVDDSSGYQYLSFMDAYSGYNQISMCEEDQEKTAFINDRGVFCYTVMPFGLKNAGATYQRMINKVFEGMHTKLVEVYINDIIAKTPVGGDHIEDLRQVFTRLREFNMRLNPMKCTFAVPAGKFLGFMLTQRGIEANPGKCQTILDMQSPKNLREIQSLNGKEQEKAFQELKEVLSKPPILTKPNPEDTLILYLAISDEALGVALIKETPDGQRPVYFTSKTLQGAEIRYQKIEKAALAVVWASRRLRPYFHAHPIIVRTDLPLRSVLIKPDLAGRMVKWSIELSEFDISYEPRSAIKAQVLADFIVEMTGTDPDSPRVHWTIYVDGSSNQRGSGAGVVLESDDGVHLEISLRFNFKTSNNQAEYEACLDGLRAAIDIGASEATLCSDSQLELREKFSKMEFRHVPREENTRADILSKLASTKRPGSTTTLVQSTLTSPNIPLFPSLNAIMTNSLYGDTWMAPYIRYLADGQLPTDEKEKTRIRRELPYFTMIDGNLYRRALSVPYLICLKENEVQDVMEEVHEGQCGHHAGGRSLM
ncbi:hypothetical protein RJT34_24812 [Clitoria ternatea]|uniref:Uncharacterized protein n=1 Tax=Clitoria ternatea TaxID=43366 RepID=A0AAN9FNW5_CLITE